MRINLDFAPLTDLESSCCELPNALGHLLEEIRFSHIFFYSGMDFSLL